MVSGLWGEWSPERTFDVEPVNTDCNQPPPGPPSGLSATDGTYTDKVRITWTAPTTGGAPTGYRIYRYTSNSSGSASEIGTSTATSYDDTSAVAGTTYWFWAKAYNNAGSSVSFSNGDSGYRQAALQPPGAPTELSATDGTYGDRVRLTWVAPATGGAPTGYRIYRHESNSSSSASEIGTSVSTSYDDYVGDFYDHWYWVKAYNSAGTGPFSIGNTGSRQRMYLSVTLDGGGTVTGPGINCGYAGNDCSEIYLYGTSVTLTANPLWPPWMFQSWYGCDSTDNLNCTVIMNNSRTVTPGYNAYEPP